jgi:hypothetical protein
MPILRKRFLFTLLTLLVIISIAGLAVFFAKGYRVSPSTGTIAGTGIISVKSIPDQASVYLDGHLTSVTDGPINSLQPGEYSVKIAKEGYIPWEKKITVSEGLVTQVEATLFRAIPTFYPMTYSGAVSPILSPDQLKMAYIVPNNDDPNPTTAKKSGVWVWQMPTSNNLGFTQGEQNRQIVVAGDRDYTKAVFRWSPDSSQLMATFPNQTLLLEADRLNDPPRDITPTKAATIKTWDETESKNRLAKLQLITDPGLRNTASNSATLKWNVEDTKILYQKPNSESMTVTDLTTKKSYDLPAAQNYQWLPTGDHLIMLEYEPKDQAKIRQAVDEATRSGQIAKATFPVVKLSIIEFDGLNKSEIYVGNLDPETVIPWADSSRVVAISSLPTATASQPNLYGINLK